MRALIMTVALSASLAGCAAAPSSWSRPDGATVAPAQLQLDETACRGAVETAAIQGQARSTLNSPFGADKQDITAYTGCMAQRGYLAAK